MSEYFEFRMQKRFESDKSTYVEHQQKLDHRSALQSLKRLIESSVNLAFKDKSCCTDDSFLNRFLYARKFKYEDAFDLLVKYMLYKEENRAILQNINIFDEKLNLALRDGNPGVLTDRDRKGRKVLTFTCTNWDPIKYKLIDVYRAFLFTIDKLLENVENQALGVVVIVDWTNFTRQQSTYLSPKILKLMIQGLQDCMPIKFKGIHFIAQPWYLDIALGVIKPFLNEKTKKHLITHGSNLTTLHNLINIYVLPPELGGEGSVLNTLDWYHYLLDCSQYSGCQKKYRLIAETSYSTSKT